MEDLSGMDEMRQDFVQEALDLLSGVDNKLVILERAPDDKALLNEIFRGFHTIKGGAGFINAVDLVDLCHLTENLFDRLRNGALQLTPESMDVIMDATQGVRGMLEALSRGPHPGEANPDTLAGLRAVLAGEPAPAAVPVPQAALERPVGLPAAGEPDWTQLLAAITGVTPTTPPGPPPVTLAAAREPASTAPTARRTAEPARDTTIRVDTGRLDLVLNLSGEIGLTKNRLTSLRSDILAGRQNAATLQALDQAVSQLDLLVSDLQNAVMKTRMQPIGRLFQKYPRIARDLARQLGKDVELVLVGEETEIDKTMVDDLADPLIHLIRNAVDHGVESPEERTAAGKPLKSTVRLEARQEGDHIILEVTDDGKGMSPERLRASAVAKGLLSEADTTGLDDRQSFNLIFLPGFSTKTEISSVSGRGVGMDVVKTNIQKLNGTIDIRSIPGKGTTFRISLPLTMAILPVLLLRLGDQPFAVPLSLVREILPIDRKLVQEVGGKGTLVVRGEILPLLELSRLLNWHEYQPPEFGVLMQAAEHTFVLGVDSFIGRDDAVVKPLEDYRPPGVSGVTTLANGQIALILDLQELLEPA